MCKIEVAGNKIGHAPIMGDYYHLHIIFTDANGKQWGMRGGPSASPGASGSSADLSGGSSRAGSRASSGTGSNSADSSTGGSGPFGYIKTDVAPYDAEFIDYPQDGETLPKITVAEGDDICEKFDELKTQMSAIDASQTRYSPLGPNSNSTVFTALSNVGVQPKAPSGVWAPGATDTINLVQACELK
jgi:hypothetical protein